MDGNLKKKDKKYNIYSGIAGAVANLATGILYPLDLLKIRMQGKIYVLLVVSEDPNRKLKEVMKLIYKKEGLNGFFRGFYFSLFAGTVSNYVFFFK
jgi:hypothetical protein